MFAPSSLLLLPALGMRLGVESLDRRSESRCRVVRRGVDSARIAFAGIYGGAAEGARTEFGDLGLTAKEEKRLWPVGPKLSAELYRTTLL